MARKTRAEDTPARKGKAKQPPKEKRPGPGRPSKFTPELGRLICETVAKRGIRPIVAAAEHGISPRTFGRWIADRNSTKELQEFAEEVARVGFVAEGRLHDKVLLGDDPGVGFGPAKAALEILSRTNRHYAPKVQLGIEQELQKFLDAARAVLPGEWWEKLLDEIDRITADDELES